MKAAENIRGFLYGEYYERENKLCLFGVWVQDSEMDGKMTEMRKLEYI